MVHKVMTELKADAVAATVISKLFPWDCSICNKCAWRRDEVLLKHSSAGTIMVGIGFSVEKKVRQDFPLMQEVIAQ